MDIMKLIPIYAILTILGLLMLQIGWGISRGIVDSPLEIGVVLTTLVLCTAAATVSIVTTIEMEET